jgi:hypothetical protein
VIHGSCSAAHLSRSAPASLRRWSRSCSWFTPLPRTLPLVAVVTALVAAPVAAADGDPASDYLIGQKVFYSFDAGIPADKADRLNAFVANANTAGFTIRVALIRTNSDLGSVYQLYGKPQQYAEFLGQELRFVYRSRLLIVMPNGFGYSVGGRPAPSARRGLVGFAAPGNDGARLADAATLAVQRLARAAGHDLPLPKVDSGSSQSSDRIKIGAIAVTCAALLAAAMLVRRGRRAVRQ